MQKVKLYNVKKEQGRKSNRYCGPAAISALTGLDTADTARQIREYSGRTMVTGTHNHEILGVLSNYHNFWFTDMDSFPKKDTRPTLARWLKNNIKNRTPGRVFLIVAGNHYLLITGRRYICGITEELVSIKDPRVKRRSRVSKVWEVHKEMGINRYQVGH